MYAAFYSMVLGRIGRIVARNALEVQGIDIVAINEYVTICYRVYFLDL